MNGLINQLFPALDTVDRLLGAVLAAPLAVAVWGASSGIIAMALYLLLSNQTRIRAQQQVIADIRQALKADPDASFDDTVALSRRNLAASFKLLGIVLGPALLSGLPVLVVILWISEAYGYQAPAPGSEVRVTVEPAGAAGEMRLVWPEAGGELQLLDEGRPVYQAPLPQAPVPIIHKRQWWNSLLGNPAGYLDEAAPFEAVYLALDPKRLVPLLPAWAAGWELIYFASIIIVSLAIKVVFKIA